jgi:hypothetical protein
MFLENRTTIAVIALQNAMHARKRRFPLKWALPFWKKKWHKNFIDGKRWPNIVKSCATTRQTSTAPYLDLVKFKTFVKHLVQPISVTNASAIPTRRASCTPHQRKT